MGMDAYDQMKRRERKSTHPEVNRYIQCVTHPLLQEVRDPTGVDHWEVTVFEDSSANAFALPGGKIGVHTGLLKVARNQHQLATVIGHEIGHVIARHGNERVSSALVTQIGMVGLSAALKDQKNKNLILAGLGLGAQIGYQLPHSRTQESEADQIGLNLMARAGFDPRQSPLLWENMKKASRGSPPEFLSTHPGHDTRIRRLQAQVPEAMKLYHHARESQNKAPDCHSP